jgi:hypothetical protein
MAEQPATLKGSTASTVDVVRLRNLVKELVNVTCDLLAVVKDA